MAMTLFNLADIPIVSYQSLDHPFIIHHETSPYRPPEHRTYSTHYLFHPIYTLSKTKPCQHGQSSSSPPGTAPFNERTSPSSFPPLHPSMVSAAP